MAAREIQFLPESVRRATGSVFHYTSASGLLAMVGSGKAWASEASSLNDVAEVRQGWEAVARILDSKPDSDPVHLLRALAHDPLKRKHEVFVLCASIAGDDANQWRLYADEARGYAIELDGTVQLAVVSDKVRAPSTTGATRRVRLTSLMDGVTVTPWLHVIYDPTEIEAVLDDLITTITAEVAYLATAPPPDDEVIADGIRDDAHEALATIAHLIKTPGFSGENEVRVVATFDAGTDHIGYRPGARGIVGYANLTQSPDGRGGALLRPEPGTPVPTALPIESVRVGPLLGKEHENTVRGFVRRHQGSRSIGVRFSDVPLG